MRSLHAKILIKFLRIGDFLGRDDDGGDFNKSQDDFIAKKVQMENANVKKENMEMIRELIAINHDRVAGYSKAISLLDNTRDSDLISVFENYSQQAQQFKSQLIPLVYREGDNMGEEEKIQKMHRQWLEVADAHGYGSRETVLVACEKGERENEKIYNIALANIEDVEENVLEAIRSQAELQSLASEHLIQLLEIEVDKSHESE